MSPPELGVSLQNALISRDALLTSGGWIKAGVGIIDLSLTTTNSQCNSRQHWPTANRLSMFISPTPLGRSQTNENDYMLLLFILFLALFNSSTRCSLRSYYKEFRHFYLFFFLFNGISTFVGYSMPKRFSYLTHSWEGKGVHTFPMGIYPKVNVIAQRSIFFFNKTKMNSVQNYLYAQFSMKVNHSTI